MDLQQGQGVDSNTGRISTRTSRGSRRDIHYKPAGTVSSVNICFLPERNIKGVKDVHYHMFDKTMLVLAFQ